MPIKRSALLIASVLLVAALLTGCGGGGDGTQSTASQASTAAQSAPLPANADAAKGAKDNEEPKRFQDGSQGSTAKHVNAAPLEVSAGGSAQFKVKGGDNSVQEYGEEAEEAELREAAEAVHSFYVARAGEEWEQACSYLAKRTIEGFEQLATQNPQLKGKGCTQILDALTEPLSPELQHAATAVDAHALRHEGTQGFLIYTGPPHETVYSMPLNLEAGKWKLGAISGSALPGVG